MRGYPLPVIYLHHITRVVASITQEGFEIIDGQQRITAIAEYMADDFALFDPVKDRLKAKFPAHIETEPCPWGGKRFSELDAELKTKFQETQISVALITTDNANEVRDLFIRLQSGSALNAQETRDAMPGGFTDFILRLGGKPQQNKWGHDYYTQVMGAKPGSDRGKTRQLAAQVAMVLLTRNQQGMATTDINSKAVNEFYYDRVDFEIEGKDAERIRGVLDILNQLLGDGKRAKLRAHDTIHAALLADSLAGTYAPDWKDRFAAAVDTFMARLASAKKEGESGEWYNHWTQYGQWTRVNSDQKDNIQRRHTFYAEEMLKLLHPLTAKDSTRAFSILDRQILYAKQNKKCAVCLGEVPWDNLEIHHIKAHHKGGQTALKNGAMVHKECHPKSAADTAKFADAFIKL